MNKATDGNPFLQQFVDSQGSIDRLYEFHKFQKRLIRYCNRFCFKIFHGAYGPEDLFQEALIKVWKYRSELLKPGNIMTEREFFGWLFVLTMRLHYSRVRQFRKNRLRDSNPFEELDIPASDDDTEAKYFLRRFLGFITRYPEVHQAVIKLWLQGYTYRDIEDKLKGTPSSCSHVTVGNWVKTSIDEFKKSVGIQLPETTLPISGTKRVGVGRSIAGR
ncbi:MAG TPA: sigma-70 family RNA polymerase sigma factor [Pyrinomonadaceae bacterium]|nr:sigma-70 family RNA polymerase sigma factor [Pyrinomonadaceae bacterium]